MNAPKRKQPASQIDPASLVYDEVEAATEYLKSLGFSYPVHPTAGPADTTYELTGLENMAPQEALREMQLWTQMTNWAESERALWKGRRDAIELRIKRLKAKAMTKGSGNVTEKRALAASDADVQQEEDKLAFVDNVVAQLDALRQGYDRSRWAATDTHRQRVDEMARERQTDSRERARPMQGRSASTWGGMARMRDRNTTGMRRPM